MKAFALLLVFLLPLKASASVPDAAQPSPSTSISLYGFPGAGLSLDMKLSRTWGFGVSFSASTPRRYYRYGSIEWDEERHLFESYVSWRPLFKPWMNGRLSTLVLFGFWGENRWIAPLCGICLTYQPAEKLALRLNAVYGPSAGIEIGYLLRPDVELTVTALSGRGILGIRFTIMEACKPQPRSQELAMP